MRKDKKLSVRRETLRNFGADLLEQIQGAKFAAEETTLGLSCPSACNNCATNTCRCPSGDTIVVFD